MEAIVLNLRIDQVNILLAGLGKLPLETSIELFNEIHNQAGKQAIQPIATPEVEIKPE